MNKHCESLNPQNNNSKQELQKLAEEIAKSFSISPEHVIELIQNESISSRTALQKEFVETYSPYDINNNEKRLHELLESIHAARKSLETRTLNDIYILKETINCSSHNFGNNNTNFSLFPKEITGKYENPETFSQHIIGAGIGAIESLGAIGVVSYELAKGILYTPYDFYNLVTGRGKIENWKKV